MKPVRALRSGERERLCILTTRAMVNGQDSLTEAEKTERQALADRMEKSSDRSRRKTK